MTKPFPSIDGTPRLLLHGLGGSVVEPEIVDRIFVQVDLVYVRFQVDYISGLTARLSSHLVNTSGSGKTRILFEGLWKHWGLYFTCADVPDLGSADMRDVLNTLPNATNFTKVLPSPSNANRELMHNRDIARRRFLQVLTARLLVLRMFLEVARNICPEGSPADIGSFYSSGPWT